MEKGRLEAFSDAVIAIVMTIMVLELKAPKGAEIEALRESLPTIGGYVLSFVYLGIYWNNHHHMLQAAKHVNGSVLWANTHLLFWLSMIPFATEWMDGHWTSLRPVVFYGFIMLMCGVAYYILARMLVKVNGKESLLAKAFGKDAKGMASVVIYLVAIGLAWLNPLIACGLYVLVGLMWLVPDRRVENLITQDV